MVTCIITALLKYEIYYQPIVPQNWVQQKLLGTCVFPADRGRWCCGCLMPDQVLPIAYQPPEIKNRNFKEIIGDNPALQC